MREKETTTRIFTNEPCRDTEEWNCVDEAGLETFDFREIWKDRGADMYLYSHMSPHGTWNKQPGEYVKFSDFFNLWKKCKEIERSLEAATPPSFRDH